jgi:uncharacterized membrane protein YgcG
MKGEAAMRTILTTLFIVSLVCPSILGGAVFDQLQTLSMDQGVTVKIQAFDKEFFKDFDVYSAEVIETPTALLFDRKDEYHLPDRFWEKLLSEKEIVYAIQHLDKQCRERTGNIFMSPRALAVDNSKGQVLGYVYTGIVDNAILMDRKKDGRVTVYRPSSSRFVGGGGGGAGGGGGGGGAGAAGGSR